MPISAGLWRVDPCELEVEFTGEETLFLFEGQIEVSVEGESEPVCLGAGQMTFFPAPVRATWRVLAPTVIFTTLE